MPSLMPVCGRLTCHAVCVSRAHPTAEAKRDWAYDSRIPSIYDERGSQSLASGMPVEHPVGEFKSAR